MANINAELKRSLSDKGYRQFKRAARDAVDLRQLQGKLDFSDVLKFKAKINQVDKMKVYVGIPEEKASRGSEPINNAELMYIQTNGTFKKKARAEVEHQIAKGFSGPYGSVREKVRQMFLLEHGSPAYNIPPRPVIEPAIRDIQDKINERFIKAFQLYVAGKEQDAEKLLNEIGLMAQANCQQWFENPKNNWPPLAPSTIKGKRKKHGENYDPIPLVDTGALRQSITYVVEFPKEGGAK